MAYRVKFTANAEKNLERLYLWVTAQAPHRGNEWFKGLENAIYSLQENPHRCPLAPENYRPEDGIRQLLHGKKSDVYRILYQVNEKGKTVDILHLRHGARMPVPPEEL